MPFRLAVNRQSPGGHLVEWGHHASIARRGGGGYGIIEWASIRNVPRRSIPYVSAVAVSPDDARSLALSLPEAVEQDHHGRPSFRVGGKIFATLWSEQRMNVMLDEGGIRTAVESAPDACEEVWWGKRLAAVGVTLARADRDLLCEVLTDAWEQKAPRRLASDR
jgi:hypothetical protein